jgi:hypothetical protein
MNISFLSTMWSHGSTCITYATILRAHKRLVQGYYNYFIVYMYFNQSY